LKIKTCKIRTIITETAYHEKCNLQNPENQIKSRKTVKKCLKKRKKADFLNSVIAKNLIYRRPKANKPSI